VSTTSEQHVDALTAMLYPAYTRRCDHCGGFVVTSPEEAMQRYMEAAYEPLNQLAQMLGDATAAAGGSSVAGLPSPVPRPRDPHRHGWEKHHHRHRGDDDCGCGHHHHEHGHGHECRCRECRRDDCHCRCCVVNADLVVHARLGERRIVPVTIENSRRREREIKLELSDFTSHSGKEEAVTGRLLSPAEFTLAACEEQDAVIGIEVGPAQRGDVTPVKPDKPREKPAPAEGRVSVDRLPDVDDCVVAYADLRIVGCDNRPVRIAVTTLPRDCHSYPVDCSSGCC
jgi:hypothetical protein